MRIRAMPVVAVLLACLPRPAHADGYVNGGRGISFGSASAQGSMFNQHFGVNADVRVMALPREAFGGRLEARYFQDLVGTNNGITTGIDFGSFHFWRASIGAVVTF